MQHARCVCGLQAAQHLVGEPQRELRPEGTLGEQAAQAGPAQELHAEIVQRPARNVLAAQVEHSADMLMADLSRQLGLALEVLQRALIARELVAQELQRNVFAEHQVLGFIHHTHATFAKLAQQLVTMTEQLRLNESPIRRHKLHTATRTIRGMQRHPRQNTATQLATHKSRQRILARTHTDSIHGCRSWLLVRAQSPQPTRCARAQPAREHRPRVSRRFMAAAPGCAR